MSMTVSTLFQHTGDYPIPVFNTHENTILGWVFTDEFFIVVGRLGLFEMTQVISSSGIGCVWHSDLAVCVAFEEER